MKDNQEIKTTEPPNYFPIEGDGIRELGFVFHYRTDDIVACF